MDIELQQRLDRIEKKVDDIFVSAEKSRKYILTIVIITVAALVLPLIGLLFAIPSFLSIFGTIEGV